MRGPGCKLPAHSVAAQAVSHPVKQCKASPVRPKLWAMLFLVNQCEASTTLLQICSLGIQAVAERHLELIHCMQCTASQISATEVQQHGAPPFEA